ncbi:hypothetical protein STEG23_030737, partial [Scotinomys teguina]
TIGRLPPLQCLFSMFPLYEFYLRRKHNLTYTKDELLAATHLDKYCWQTLDTIHCPVDKGIFRGGLDEVPVKMSSCVISCEEKTNIAAAVAGFAVSQTVQTASTLNRFAWEVSEALQIQENINGQLHFGTEFLQEQVDILWIQQNLACDLGYHDMCVIAVIGIVAGLVLIRRMCSSVRRSHTATKQALLAMKPSGDAQVWVAMI